MYYLVTHLQAHARTSVFLRAPNAAAAVAMAGASVRRAGSAFELLSVTLVPEQVAEDMPELAVPFAGQAA